MRERQGGGASLLFVCVGDESDNETLEEDLAVTPSWVCKAAASSD